MTVTAVVGANWGDEGKGKITDALAGEADFVIRFQGGSNAGHTILNDFGKFALHLLPSGVFDTRVVNLLGPGVALNIRDLLNELEALVARGIPAPQLLVSNRAQVVLPYHVLLDEWEEERLGEKKFGSTKSGIAPFYADKYLKLGVQVADLYDGERLRERVQASLASKNVLIQHLYGKAELTVQALVEELQRLAEQLRPYVADTTAIVHKAVAEGKRIVVEGQLGALRDPDYGIYPYSTSSSTLAGFAAVGAGVPPYALKRIIAVTKAYSSCVGEGPFVTELAGAAGEELRRRGGDAGEYGVKTGRPRRVGWFDCVATRYGCRVQGATEAALTNLDVLGYLEEIPICTAYRINGKLVKDFPATAELVHAEPVWETLPGWRMDLSQAAAFEELPLEAKQYVARLEELIGVPIRLVSHGPKREQLLRR